MQNKRKIKKSKLSLVLILIAIIVTIIIVFSTKSEDKQITPTTEDTGEKLQNVRILEDGTKLNTSEKVNKDRKVGEYEITNIKLTYKDGITRILAEVKNISNNKLDVATFNLTLYDKNGNKLEDLEGMVGKLEPGKSTELNVGASSDFSQAGDLKIEKN